MVEGKEKVWIEIITGERTAEVEQVLDLTCFVFSWQPVFYSLDGL